MNGDTNPPPTTVEQQPAVPHAAAVTQPTGPKASPALRSTFHWGTGRRKTSVARVRIKSGEGKYLVNDREVDDYFPLARDRHDVLAPLNVADCAKKVDVFVNVSGGGPTGQAGAIMLGLARALLRYNPDWDKILRESKFLTRDSRAVERKKYGQSGARRRFQFSKR